MAEEQKRRDEEALLLKERILQAKLEHEAEKKRKEAEERQLLKQLKIEGKTRAQKGGEDS